MKESIVALCLLAAVLPAGGAVADTAPPVVVELFTSHGCPACPPAEEYFHDLAGRADLIALEFHIDYYDFEGWTDPLARPEFTRRWQGYVRALDARYAYTPFMTIDGAKHEVGSRRDAVERAIGERKADRTPRPTVSLRVAAGQATVRVDGAAAPAGPYDLILATYDRRVETRITAGGNSGRLAVNADVVRAFRRLGEWTGGALDITVKLDGMGGDGGVVVLLQRSGNGPIAAAARVAFGG